MTGQPRPHVRPPIPHRSDGRTGHRIAIEPPPAPQSRAPADAEGGNPSMDPRTAASPQPDPEAVEFIRFCYQRRRVGWPELYDEMCAVAARGLYRGYGSDDLAGFGIGFSLFEMPSLAAMSARVVAEEQARRRPVSVTIRAEVPAAEVAESHGHGRAGRRGGRGDRRGGADRTVRDHGPGPAAAHPGDGVRARALRAVRSPVAGAQPDLSVAVGARGRPRLSACPRSGSPSPPRH